MTIFVEVLESSHNDEWTYWYDNQYDMLSISRANMSIPLSTLQGAYNLIVKSDQSKLISHLETVATAEVTYWIVQKALKQPEAIGGRVVVLQDVDDGQEQSYFTNPKYTLFYARFGLPAKPSQLRHIAIGQQIIVDIALDGMIAGVWMLDLPTEIGQKHANRS